MVMCKDEIAFYIVLNIIFFTIILIRSLIWLIVVRKLGESYIEYTMWSDMGEMNYIIANINTAFILIINSMFIIFYLTNIISLLL